MTGGNESVPGGLEVDRQAVLDRLTIIFGDKPWQEEPGRSPLFFRLLGTGVIWRQRHVRPKIGTGYDILSCREYCATRYRRHQGQGVEMHKVRIGYDQTPDAEGRTYVLSTSFTIDLTPGRPESGLIVEQSVRPHIDEVTLRQDYPLYDIQNASPDVQWQQLRALLDAAESGASVG